ncbi:hypothetical protein QBC33DRAFT_521004 [Phialemonium atrogriseum]|uniref:Defect at low temperature protein 1 n=1 Tax=Phialemonium atrogriseum TaxID=1093897 RepID=A0AAJ0FTP5_9PEZI|nr:uncharacterized protein QBC33DRAFT_521004 [Phialemonium atrogriseum]KAK1772365.1 hypothetical protein QBC33DRAFT_521004 [Phialemonium atrogriseum]
MSSASLASRIIYRSLYFFLNLILVLLLLLIPADVIRKSIIHSEFYNILVITLCYLVTILIVAFIYATRLYINRSVLSSIPKTWVPVEKGDVNKHVRKIIVAGLSRSAAIAYAARPRVPLVFSEQNSECGDEGVKSTQLQDEEKSQRIFKLKKTATVEDEMGISLPPHKPVWGEIEHPGWASPTSPDLPNLQYESVVMELPNLIEAKALTLAPSYRELQNDQPTLDLDAASLLQRPESMGLRDYLTHLAELHVLETTQIVPDFITKYEFARFSNQPISNTCFRDLMHLFAEVLRSMHPLDPAVLDTLDEDSSYIEAPSDSDFDNDVPPGANPSTPRTRPRQGGRRSPDSNISQSTSSTTAISRSHRPSLPARNSSANTGLQYRTAPTTPKSRQTALSRSSSANTFAQTRHPYPISQSSSSSLRSDASVIRLSEREDSTDLPYVLALTNTR